MGELNTIHSLRHLLGDGHHECGGADAHNEVHEFPDQPEEPQFGVRLWKVILSQTMLFEAAEASIEAAGDVSQVA